MADLARVAARYSPEEWESLIDAINDEARRAELSAVLKELAAASRPRRQRRPAGGVRTPPRAERVRGTLARIREGDAARADLLEDVWLKLRQRELLPTMPLMRAFAEAMGMKGLDAAKREQAVTELMEQIVEIPADALEQMMRDTVVHDRKLGEEYEQWVRLILRQPKESPDR